MFSRKRLFSCRHPSDPIPVNCCLLSSIAACAYARRDTPTASLTTWQRPVRLVRLACQRLGEKFRIGSNKTGDIASLSSMTPWQQLLFRFRQMERKSMILSSVGLCSLCQKKRGWCFVLVSAALKTERIWKWNQLLWQSERFHSGIHLMFEGKYEYDRLKSNV